MCGLVYQTVWLRAFRLIFGASTPSTAAVLAIFMGGLGVGGLLLGRRVERSARPLVTYGNLELGVAAGAAVTPFLLDAARAAYVVAGGSEGLGAASTVVRLLLSVLVLGVPVVLMGGTLPAAARAVTAESDVGRKGLSLLYGTNTLGAVAGALLSTFALLEIYGARKTLWLACLVNAVIGLLARACGKALDPVIAPAPAPPEEKRRFAFSSRWVLAAAFLTGFVFLLAELVWYRVAAPLLGGSTYTFGLVLACALFGVGIGGVLYAFAGPREPTPSRFAVTCALEALVLLVPYAAGDELSRFAVLATTWGRGSFPLLILSWTMVTALLVMPAAVVAGYQFPMLLSLKGRAAREVGKDSGEVYAANTLGSIAGSLSGGFALLPVVDAVGLWRASAAALVALAGVVAVVAVFQRGRSLRSQDPGRATSERPRLALVSVLTACTLVCLMAHGPAARGRGATVAVDGADEDEAVVDAPAGVGVGLIPAALFGAPRTAFVIGLGSGQTAGWLGALPSMERVDVAEVEPAMRRFAQRCDPTNQRALENPKVRVHIADGRELLAVTHERYDLVLSEPSGNENAGVASFTSREFYASVYDKLHDGGVFGQRLQSDEIDPAAMRLVLATLKSVFPSLSAWQLGAGDMLIVATKAPQVWDTAALDALVQTEPYRTAFRRLFGVTGAEGVLALHIASDVTLTRLARGDGDDLNTDDLPRLEFLFARATRRSDARADLQALADANLRDRPTVRGAIDWRKVDAQRGRPFVWRNQVPPDPLTAALPTPLMLWSAGRARESVAAFSAMQEPLDDVETLAFAAARSEIHEDDRTAFNDLADHATAAGFVADAAWVRVRAALSDGRDAELAGLLDKAMDASSRDPWPTDRIVLPALQELVEAPPSLASLVPAPGAHRAAMGAERSLANTTVREGRGGRTGRPPQRGTRRHRGTRRARS